MLTLISLQGKFTSTRGEVACIRLLFLQLAILLTRGEQAWLLLQPQQALLLTSSKFKITLLKVGWHLLKLIHFLRDSGHVFTVFCYLRTHSYHHIICKSCVRVNDFCTILQLHIHVFSKNFRSLVLQEKLLKIWFVRACWCTVHNPALRNLKKYLLATPTELVAINTSSLFAVCGNTTQLAAVEIRHMLGFSSLTGDSLSLSKLWKKFEFV